MDVDFSEYVNQAKAILNICIRLAGWKYLWKHWGKFLVLNILVICNFDGLLSLENFKNDGSGL